MTFCGLVQSEEPLDFSVFNDLARLQPFGPRRSVPKLAVSTVEAPIAFEQYSKCTQNRCPWKE
jgi:hypothetical protein